MTESITIRSLLGLIQQWAPSVANGAVGADQSDIDEYACLAATEIPQAFLDYLLLFGANDGGFKPFQEPTTDIKSLIRYYNAVESGDALVPENSIIIAVGGLGVPEVCIQNQSPTSKPVFVSDDDDIICKYGDSLECVLFHQVMLKYKYAQYPYQAYLCGRGQVPLFELVKTELDNFGFRRLAFSDSINDFLETNDLGVYYRQYNEPIYINIFSYDLLKLNSLKNYLITKFDLRPN